MAVSATFLTKVKTSLRVSFNNLDEEITSLIEEAVLDLTETADIKPFTTNDADALQTGAVISYVSYKFFNDDSYFKAYNDMKEKMALSAKYRSVAPYEE